MIKSFEQRIFTRVKNHLLKQNKRSVSTNGECMYRIKKNGKILKCAIGCLIQKKYYDITIEKYGFCVSYSYFGKNIASQKLKRLHDINRPSVWKSNLKELAKEYELKY